MFRLPRVPALLAVALSVAIAGCGDRGGPSPDRILAPTLSYTAGDPALASEIRALMDRLFSDPNRLQQAKQHFDQLVDAWSKGDVAGALNKKSIIEKQTLDQLQQSKILDPDGTGPLTPTTGVLHLFNLINAYVGQPAYGELDPDAYIALVVPSTDTQTFDSGLDATMVVPGGATSEITLLYILRDEDAPNLNTGLQAASDVYDVRFIPDIEFTNVTLGICIWPPNSESRLAHEIEPGQIIIYTPPPLQILCEDPEPTHSAAPQGSGLRGLVLAMAHRAARALSPRTAYAGHAATAGTLSDLSPFQVVLTGTEIEASANGGTYGGSATIDAWLLVDDNDDATDVPIAGRTLSLSVDGTLVGTQTTGTDGKASWSVTGLAAGTHTYEVSFAGDEPPGYYQPSSISGSFSVATASLTITASSATITYPTAVPACTVSYSGLVGGDTPSSPGLASSCTYAGLSFGTHPVYPSMPTTTNYTVTLVPGTFTYNRKALTVTASSASIVFGQPIPACTVSYTGLVAGDVLNSTCAYPNTLGTSTVYPTMPTTSDANKYVISLVPGTFAMMYLTSPGHEFTSPLPMREIKKGSSIPAKFSLYLADGKTPVANKVFPARVTGVNGGNPVGYFTYKTGENNYQLGLDTSTWPLGQRTIIADLDDGSTVQVTVIIK